MSVLNDVFQEEKDRLLRMRAALEKERAQLPEGYLSQKMIHGRPYYYLQKRENRRVVGRYVPYDQMQPLAAQIERRRQLEAALREINADLEKLERVIK